MNQSDDDSHTGGRLSFFADPKNWPLFYHTAKNMKARQLVGVAERKVRHVVVPRLPIDFDQWYEQHVPETLQPNPDPIAANLTCLRQSYDYEAREQYRRLAAEAADGKITFLNRSIDFGDGSKIDWDHEKLDDYPLLWRLKLQSFEHLEWLTLGYEEPSKVQTIDSTFQQWLLSWARRNPIGEPKYLRRSWIPHSVSLRVLNWSRYAAWRDGTLGESPELYREIYRNALFLEKHIEWDIDGNHLIENAAALIVAGVLFDDHDQDWIETGVDVLEHAARTQFLADGGHFERSPMYHIMVLMRYLTADDLLSRTSGEVPQLVEQTAEDGVRYLRAIQAPDGQIPLLNDSVYGEERSASTCLGYARRVGIDAPEPQPPSVLEDSGYYWLGSGDTQLLIDCGSVGPPHLPAHSHNDHLSINLWVDGQPVLVDTGTYEYAPTKQRQYSRSVEAHNTVQVDGQEPIDIGGQFLMGRRTTPEVTHYETGEQGVFEGVVRKRSLIGGGYTHRRRIRMNEDQLRVQDSVTGGEFTSRLHFHPEVTVTMSGNGTYVAETSTSKLSITPVPAPDQSEVVTSEYYPQFGAHTERETIEFSMDSNRDQLEYLLKTEEIDDDEQADERVVIGK